jgi:hypothetical protein
MRRFIATAVLVLVSTAAFAQSRPADITAAPDIAAAYKALSVLDRGERKAFLHALTPEARAAIWTLHVQIVVAEHPELTAEQRAAALALTAQLQPALFVRAPRTRDDELDQLAARTDMDGSMDRARAILPPDVYARLVGLIGPIGVIATPSHPTWRVVANLICDCANVPGDPCYLACARSRLCTAMQDGCGPFGTDACVAECQ